MKCKKKGHLSFNCPPKYACKVIKPKDHKYKSKNQESANKVEAQDDDKAKSVEFAGMASIQTSSSFSTPKCRNTLHYKNKCPQVKSRKTGKITNYKNNDWKITESFNFHSKRINKICTRKTNHYHKRKFYDLLFQKKDRRGLKMVLSRELRKLGYHDQLSALWLITFLNRHKRQNNNKYKYKTNSNTKYNSKNSRTNHEMITPPRNNKRHTRDEVLGSTFAFNVEHELLARNHLPAHDLERGWVIDSGASAHMTPFRKDCKNIQTAHRKIFLADGSVVTCKEMGIINIPIQNGKTILGTLRLDNVLIVPSLDRRLFSVNSFLQNGNNWVHFENNSIHLGIRDGPKIRIPISSLQSNALIVREIKHQNRSRTQELNNIKKVKLNTNILHDRFHRSDGAMATIKAHDLWHVIYLCLT